MTDLLADVRERFDKLRTVPGVTQSQVSVSLLELSELDRDIQRAQVYADALLAVLPFAQHYYKCAEMPYDEPCICGYTEAVAALPEHLKEEA